MIINQTGAKFTHEGVEYAIGGAIIGIAKNEYEGLYGYITEIRDGCDKDTENETPDIYCTFSPPVLPNEISKLEERFTDLYDQPKTLDDIILDMVIMAPDMIRTLDDLCAIRNKTSVFIVTEDWTVDDEHGATNELFTDYEDAKRIMTEKLREELKNGSISLWAGREEFAVDLGTDSYEAYLEGEYLRNHYAISILRQPLSMSSRYIREIGDMYTAQCHTEDFASQLEKLEGVSKLTNEQYQKLIHDPSIPERIDKKLGRNDRYWESFWESVSAVCQELLSKTLE